MGESKRGNGISIASYWNTNSPANPSAKFHIRKNDPDNHDRWITRILAELGPVSSVPHSKMVYHGYLSLSSRLGPLLSSRVPRIDK